MLRRDLLRAAAATTALSWLPRDAVAIWARVATFPTQQVVTPLQASLIAAMADTIIPRTGTPGANDVGVPAFINVIVAEYYSDAERVAFLSGVDAINTLSQTIGGAPFATLSGAQRTAVMEALERPADRTLPAVRAYVRLKGLVVHGYFTSERVQKDVLKSNIMPGKFEGNAPMRARIEGAPNGQ